MRIQSTMEDDLENILISLSLSDINQKYEIEVKDEHICGKCEKHIKDNESLKIIIPTKKVNVLIFACSNECYKVLNESPVIINIFKKEGYDVKPSQLLIDDGFQLK